jgi:hypothetical protein
MWRFVLREGAEKLNAAVKTAWAALVDDAERLAQGAIKNADLLLQIGRGRRTAALAADLAEAAGTDVLGAEHAAGVLAGLLDCYLLQQLGEKLHAQEQPEIGPLKDLPELQDAGKQVLYYVAGSMRYTLVKYRKLKKEVVKCLFFSAKDAADCSTVLPTALTEHREKYGGFSYAKPAFWNAVHALDRVYTKFCSANAIARFGKAVVDSIAAATVGHTEIQALFVDAAALCKPAISGPELAKAVVETLAFSRQKELVVGVRRELGLQAEQEQALRAKLKSSKKAKKEGAKKRKGEAAARVAERAEKVGKFAPGKVRLRARVRVQDFMSRVRVEQGLELAAAQELAVAKEQRGPVKKRALDRVKVVLHEVEAGKAAALAAVPAAARKKKKKRKQSVQVSVAQGEHNPYARCHQSYRRGSRSKS